MNYFISRIWHFDQISTGAIERCGDHIWQDQQIVRQTKWFYNSVELLGKGIPHCLDTEGKQDNYAERNYTHMQATDGEIISLR